MCLWKRLCRKKSSEKKIPKKKYSSLTVRKAGHDVQPHKKIFPSWRSRRFCVTPKAAFAFCFQGGVVDEKWGGSCSNEVDGEVNSSHHVPHCAMILPVT